MRAALEADHHVRELRQTGGTGEKRNFAVFLKHVIMNLI